MGDEEFVELKLEGNYNSGLSSRDSFVMEPAESSPIVNSQPVEPEKEPDKSTAPDVNMNTASATAPADTLPAAMDETNKTDNEQGWSSWGNAFYSVASSSVKALEHGVAKVLDVIEDDGVREDPYHKRSESKSKDVAPTTVEASGGSAVPLPSGMKDDLRVLSSAVQRTSGKLMSSGMGMLSALGKRTLDALVAEEEGMESTKSDGSSLSSRIREAKALTLQHEKEQHQQLAYWFDLSGGNDSFEAFRCFSQSSVHSLAGKIEVCRATSDDIGNIVPETYEKIAEIFSASSDRLIRSWDSPDFATSGEEGDLLDSLVLATVIKDRLSLLTAPPDRLISSLSKAKTDLLASDGTQDPLYEATLSNLANFTAATIDFLHKSVQLLHASALSTHAAQSQPGKGSFIRSECASVLEIAASFSTASLILTERIRAISLAGKAAVMKTVSESSVQPDDDSSPELAVASLDMEATDCAAHLARMLGLLVPIMQHLLLLRLYGADCRPIATTQAPDDS